MAGRGGPATLAAARTASAVPDAERWHAAKRNAAAEREAVEKERRDAEAEKDAKVHRALHTARAMEDERDGMERNMREAQLVAMHQVHEVQWRSVQQAAEYEDRIRELEALLAEERREAAARLREREELVARTRTEAEAQVREAERRCNVAVAAANARAREAAEMAEAAQRRAEEEVRTVRAREDSRVAGLQHRADVKVHECHEQKQFELEQIQAHVIQRQRAMEETLHVNGRANSEALTEARRHLMALDVDFKALGIARHAGATIATGSPTLGQTTPRHALLEIEKTLHKKTMERNMDRLHALST